MKKRVLSLTLAAVMLLGMLVLVGCGGGDDPLVGKWNATKIEYMGVEMTPEEADMEFYLEFKSDGHVTATTNGEDDGEATWEAGDDGTFTITSDDEAIEGSYEGTTMTLDMYGITITLEKE